MKYLYLFFTSSIIIARPEIFVDKYNVDIGEQIELTIQVENSRDYPQVDLSTIQKDFKIINGPRTKDITQINNGDILRIKSMSWNLLPNKSGIIVIPPLLVTTGGNSFRSKKITISVGKSSNKKESKDIFVQAEIDKISAFMGEQITLTYRLYKRSDANIRAIDNLIMPEYKGFWTEELYTPKQYQYQSKDVVIQGLRYQIINLGQKALFPISSSEHNIPPLEITVQMDKKKKRNRRDPFADFFSDSFFAETKTKTLFTKNKQIEIKPFPNTRPKDFVGAVGQFEFSAVTDRKDIKVNEALTLTIELSGTGNIGLFSIPTLDFPSHIEAFPPSENIEKDGFRNQITGSQVLEYILIPREKGIFKIPSIQMSFFNPKLNIWQQTNSDEITINVLSDNENIISNQGFTKREIELIGEDIRYIHSEISTLNLFKNNRNVYSIIYIISIFVISLPYLTEIFTGYSLSTEANKRKNNALRINLKKLKNNPVSNPFEISSKIVYSYLKDKLNLPSVNLDPAKVRAVLKDKVDNKLCNQLVGLLITCDEGKYSPNVNGKRENITDEVIELLSILDKEL